MALNLNSVGILESNDSSAIERAKDRHIVRSVPEGEKTEYIDSLALLYGVVLSKNELRRLQQIRPEPPFSWYIKVKITSGPNKGLVGWVPSKHLGRNYPP